MQDKKPRGGNNNPSGKGGFKKGEPDTRRNVSGQRNAAAVSTATQARELYVRVLNEPVNVVPTADMTNLELIVRQHVQAAKKGDAAQREQMFDRLWGKAAQPVEHSGTVQTVALQTTLEELKNLPPDELVRLYNQTP